MILKQKYLQRTILALILLFISFGVYVMMVNSNSRQMTPRQKILKAFYPALMWWTRRSSRGEKGSSFKNIIPAISFYSLKDTTIEGKEFDFSQLKGKKVLLVNTASDCGYTGQYEELEKLSNRYKDKLLVIGFPANDFKQQEKGTNEEIQRFCKNNYAINFPLMKKSIVVRAARQNEVFKWLTSAAKNGWNNRQPGWNFSKYLVSEDGRLINYFAPAISPLSNEILNAIEEK